MSRTDANFGIGALVLFWRENAVL